MRDVALTVNGTERQADVEPRRLLVYFIRETLGLTGTNVGCDTSTCGSCTVLVDGESVKSCTMLAVQADGQGERHDQIEGLAFERRAASRSRRRSTSITGCSAATARRGRSSPPTA